MYGNNGRYVVPAKGNQDRRSQRSFVEMNMRDVRPSVSDQTVQISQGLRGENEPGDPRDFLEETALEEINLIYKID